MRAMRFSLASRVFQSRSRLRARSITRARRVAMTPSSAAMPVSRKTGAIASWIAWAMRAGLDSTGMAAGRSGLRDGHDLDLDQPPGIREPAHLEDRSRRQVRLLLRAEELRVALHQPLEVHLPLQLRVAHEEDLHLDHVGEREVDALQVALDVLQHAHG